MRTTPVGIVMFNDEREHVYTANDQANRAVVAKWQSVLQERLRNVDGSGPTMVAGSEIVTGTRSAQKVGEELQRAGCRQIIMLYNVWDFPFLVWPFLNSAGARLPILSLSSNSGKFPGNVGLLATDGALRQAGVRTHRIIGAPDEESTLRDVTDWVRASVARTTIANEVYGLYGGHSMGMETGYHHLVPVLKALGTTVHQIDQLLLVEKMKEVAAADVERGMAWFRRLLGDRLLWDGHMLTPDTLAAQLRLYRAMQMVNQEKGFDFCGLKGQRELTEYVCLGDVAEMLMNDPYDWDGPKEPCVCATEADSFAALTMQLLKYVTGGLPVLFMDVRLYHPDRDLWDWCNSGNHASYYAECSFVPEENFRHITFHPAMEYYFKAGGASVEFDAAPGPMTFARLGLWDDAIYMVIAAGEVVDLPAAERKALNAETDPTWPHAHVKLEGNFAQFLQVFPCNHVLGVPGDWVRALVYLCEIAGIQPIVLGREVSAPIWERMGRAHA